MSIYRRFIPLILISFATAFCNCGDVFAGGMGGMGGIGGGRGGGRGGGGKQYVPPDPESKVNPFAPDAKPTVGAQARLDALEKWVNGKVTKGSLESRAQHLEKKLVPYEHNLASMDIEKRVGNLWTIVAKANENVVTTPRLNEQ